MSNSNFLTSVEADLCRDITVKLEGQNWAVPLLKSINKNGGLIAENKSMLFELRFAYALHKASIQPEYEVKGKGSSTIDFGFSSNEQKWKVELMRLEETDAVKNATRETPVDDGVSIQETVLSTDAKDSKQSEEGETLKAIQRICQKCENNGKPHKFPIPQQIFHMLLINCRTLMINGGDKYDQIHIALGGEYLSEPFHRRYWKSNLISGVFNKNTSSRGALEVQERVHFLGFVNEKELSETSFGGSLRIFSNPFLFQDTADAKVALKTWPI